LAGGIGGDAAAGIALKGLLDEKSDILHEKSRLTAQVKLASGISTGYGSLVKQVEGAVEAATNMEDSWRQLGGNLETMWKDLADGVDTPGTMRTQFLTDANTEVQEVIKDIATVKEQVSGVKLLTAPAGQTVADMVQKLSA